MGHLQRASAPKHHKDGPDGHADPIKEKKILWGTDITRAPSTPLISTETALDRSTRGKKGGLDSRPPPS